PSKEPIAITEGRLASAISASCAMRIVRRPVAREGRRLKDGGIACVLPALACREMGADFVVASDVWELGALLRALGLRPAQKRGGRIYPLHYLDAVRHTDLLIQPRIPAAGYVPGARAVELMIDAGYWAARQQLAPLLKEVVSSQ